MTPMLTARADIKGIYCRGKLYAIGGDRWDSLGYFNFDSCEAYDIASNSWSHIASLPVATNDYQAVVWRDSLIYVLGGTSSDSAGTYYLDTVRIYNPFTDRWTLASPMLAPCTMSDACIVGDSIFFAGGMMRGSLYDSVMRIGAINPAAPEQIVWSWGARLPEARYNGPTVALDGRVYWFGGGTNARCTDKAYVYSPATRDIAEIPDYPSVVVGCCLGVARESRPDLYGLGGYDGNTGMPTGYFRYRLAGYYDVGPVRIVAPAADSGDTITPVVVIGNFGRHPEGFRAMLRIAESYSDVESTYMPPGETARVSFRPWIANCRGRQVLSCSTMMAGDDQPENDVMIDTFTVEAFDAGVAGLMLPESIAEGDFTPTALVSNYSQMPGSVHATWLILRNDTQAVYAQSESVYLAAGASQQVMFPAWNATAGGYLAKVFLLRNGTTLRDTVRRHFLVVSNGIADPEQTELLLPREIALDAPEPNPCRDGAVIRYALPRPASGSLKLYDRTGKCVAVLVQGLSRVGWHSCALIVHQPAFIVPPGVYFVRLQAEGVEKTRKVIIAE